jgi:succinate dehydrogenase / fumarate reductase, cytochrome b subunit
MSWFSQAINSSIGKKFTMAVTGACLILFLAVHLVNNLTLYLGPDIFNKVVKNLDGIKVLVRVVEAVLVLSFFLHILNGIRLWLENKKARPILYMINASSKNTDVFARTMIWSGSIIFIFLVIHLRTFWVFFNLGHPLALTHNYYEIIVEAFQSPIYSGLYVVAILLLGFHLKHAFHSAFQTFGWDNVKYLPILKRLGMIFTIIVVLGFTSIPIYFLFFYGGK